jgi:hypothetical protein
MSDQDAQARLDINEALERMGQRITERDRQLAQLGAAAPMRSKGRAVEDVGHLPLFVAADEPRLI